ncbi:MAG: hypothetical protein U9O63_06425 [Actinomycetota bacterium]|nr:hypothetical protein [Actinomycetota bacterium]
MKRRLLLLLAIVVVLSTVIAAPVSAKEPLRGDQVMTLNQDDQGNFGLHGCPEIAWFGTVVFDDTTYGMALYPIGSVFPGTTQHWEETWKIFTDEFMVAGGELDDCEPGDVVLSGWDKGVIAFVTPKFHSLGVVEDASSPFEEWSGRRLHQDGVVGLVSVAGLEDVFGFTGSVRLN